MWGDFSPEDALLSGTGQIRANRAVRAEKSVESMIEAGLRRYVSQAAIIDDLIKRRKDRIRNNGAIELYLDVDPRPALNYKPYWNLIERIDKSDSDTEE